MEKPFVEAKEEPDVDGKVTCANCGRLVEAERSEMNATLLIIMCLLFIPAALIYYVMYLMKPKNMCPICGEVAVRTEGAKA